MFTFIGLSVPVGIVLTAVGMMPRGRSEHRDWRFAVFVAEVVAAALSMMAPQTLGYYPAAFGISGGLVLLFFFATLWF